MKKTGLFALLGALVISALVGCGGNVTVETTGGGGDGGSGGAGSTGSSTSPPQPAGFCSSICSQAAQYGCLDGTSVSECAQGCLGIFEQYPDCGGQIVALYNCAVQDLANGCDGGTDTCEDEAIAFGDCAGNVPPSTCGTGACSIGDDSTCYCEGECNGSFLQVDCKQDASGVFCSCQMDGQQVGTCNDTSLTCDVLGGCCSEYFL